MLVSDSISPRPPCPSPANRPSEWICPRRYWLLSIALSSMQALSGYISYMRRYSVGVRFGMTTFAPALSPSFLPLIRLIVASAVVLGIFAVGHAIRVRAIILYTIVSLPGTCSDARIAGRSAPEPSGVSA